MKVVTIGGGSGASLLDEALTKEFSDLTAVVTSFDDGGSTGLLRAEFGHIPQGDIRRRIFAQKRIEDSVLEDVYNFRFGPDNSLENHSVGNLIILTAQKIWGEKKGIEKICKLFKIPGNVLPVTYDYAVLAAKLSNGKRLIGEDLVGQSPITKRENRDGRRIEKIYLTRETKVNKDVVLEIKNADYIILSFGDFYTSLLVNFLVPGFKEAVFKSKAKTILYVNTMTKMAETPHFKVSDFVNEAEKYMGKSLDYILVNNKKIEAKLLKKYKKQEGAEPVLNDLKQKDLRVLEFPLVKSNGHIRHDKDLVLKSFKKVLEIEKLGKVKYVFDLDDTLIPTFKYNPEYRVGNYKNLKFFDEARKVLQKLKKENCILLTYDRYGDQPKKLKHLNIEKYFSEIIVVDEKIKKKYELEKLMKKNKNLLVIGDRYDEGELYHAETLGLKTVCVAMPGGLHYNKNHHHKHDLIIEKEDDFWKI
jgi:uncharacterized cofD-like protein